MLKNRRMKKSLKLKENFLDFGKTYHGKLITVIIKEKIERDLFGVKDQFKIWNFKAQRLLIKELEVNFFINFSRKVRKFSRTI